VAAYYNENDPKIAAWLRELIHCGLIVSGDVDERSVEDVLPSDLAAYNQCHFFAGIGTWSYALRQAGWSDDRPVWTGSCPCTPFSSAGKRGGFADQRHLWPAWFWLISQCQPGVIFGEQVASSDGLAWLDLVCADLEGAGYAVGSLDLCAAGFGAPHIRQRLYFVADSERWTTERRGYELAGSAGGMPETIWERRVRPDTRHGGYTGILADTNGQRCDGKHALLWEGQVNTAKAAWRGAIDELADTAGRGASAAQQQGRLRSLEQGSATGLLGDSNAEGSQGRGVPEAAGRGDSGSQGSVRPPGPVNGFWANAEWLPCCDGKARPVEPGTFPLAHGTPARVGRLRGYGNAIVAPVAIEFIRAYLLSCG
jgi:DNA (cytosine-5)-methyltransferase 1